MHTGQDKETFGRARLSFADEADIDEFVSMLAKFESGEITPDEWRAFRLVRGTYGQRQNADAQMLRIKIPQGILSRAQLDALGDVAARYSRGFGHITTRQNVQLHFLKLHDVEPAMRQLADAGMTTREACGNSVRNITACPYAGVAGDEAFDVTPYAEALTRYLLRHPLSAKLPRKFKIAFEGCPDDHIALAINDIGWQARVRTVDGRVERGFRVTVAGGTSTLPRAGNVLYEFLPVGEMFDVAEAIIRVFHRLGDYKHKARNRLKFLVRSLGWDGFKAEFDRELEAFRAEGGARLPFDPEAPPSSRHRRPNGDRESPFAGLDCRARGFDAGHRAGHRASSRTESRGRSARVRAAGRSATSSPQKQAGWSAVIVSTLLGDLTTAQMHLIGELAEAFGDGTRARDTRPEPRVPVGPDRSRSGPVSKPARRRSRAGWSRVARRRDELPRRRVVQAGGHAVAGPRPSAGRGSLRPSGPRPRQCPG